MDGWIKLHRQILDNPIVCKDADYLAVWIYLLLNATHDEYITIFKGKKITLKAGQLIAGRKEIAEKLSINESKIYRIINAYKSEQQIEQQTSNKNSLITIINWDKYQIDEQQANSKVNNKRTANEQQNEQQSEQQANVGNTDIYLERLGKNQLSEQQNEQQNERKVNTNKNTRNIYTKESITKVIPKKSFVPPTVDEVKEYCLQKDYGMKPEEFVDFYQSKNWYVGKNKMTDWKASVRNWERKEKDRPITQAKKSKQSFDQRTYNYKDLEKQLVENRRKKLQERKKKQEG